MHSTDEQLKEIMRRAETVKEKRVIKKRIRASAFAAAAFAALLIAVCIYIPKLDVVSDGSGMQRYGSLLIKAPYMGYVVVGVIAFALGICVTFLCINWKRLKQKDLNRK